MDAKILGNLHYTEARERSKLVSNVRSEYTLTFESLEKDSFKGEAQISFHYTPNKDVADPLKYLFMETTAFAVSQASINGTAMSPAEIAEAHNKDQKRFYIKPQDPATEQDITLSVTYECEYTNDLISGIHKVENTIKGNEYNGSDDKKEVIVWTSFEPFTSHTTFICFNQPSIKSIFKLSVIAPKEYSSYSNGKEIATVPVSDTLVKHEYDTFNVQIPSYLFSVVLGDIVQTGARSYTSFHDATRAIPLSVLVPKSAEKIVDSENILDILSDSLDYYERKFDEPYYYEKYDCVFVPKYNFGAMENPGLVVFTDNYLFRTTPEQIEYTRRAETIVHETMHMWLGDSVTPVWWDSIWLSEGFASYFGYDAKRAVKDKVLANERWIDCHNVKHNHCFSLELLKNTHPIQNTASGESEGTYDTNLASTYFDPISYGKGGAVVKQLVATIGEESFTKALREYIKKYKFANANYSDFKSVFTKYISEDWLDRWLCSKGLSSLIPKLGTDPATGHITSFTIQQTPTAYDKVFLPHHVEVGLFDFDKDASSLKLRKAVPIDIRPVEGEQDFMDAVFAAEEDRTNPPAFVYINFRELTFAKCAIDSRSLAFIGTNLDTLISKSAPEMRKKDDDDNEMYSDIILLYTQVLESLATMLKDIIISPEKFVACMIPVSMLAEKAHKKIAVEIKREVDTMMSIHELIPLDSKVLTSFGKYCFLEYILNGNKRAGEVAIKIIRENPEVADFCVGVIVKHYRGKFSNIFWYSVVSLTAWRIISSLGNLQQIAMMYYGISDVSEKESLKDWAENIWKTSNGEVGDAEAVWDKCLAANPSGANLFEEVCYAGLFMTPSKPCLLELVEKKKDTITLEMASKIVDASENAEEVIDKIAALNVCLENPDVQKVFNRLKSINKGIKLAKARYSQLK